MIRTIVMVLVTVSLSLCSCLGGSSRPSGSSGAPAIDDKFVQIHLSKDNIATPWDMVAEAKIVRLDSKIGLIGEIKRTIVTDDNIIIADENSVFVFDREGEGKVRISRQGRGPEDYLQLTHMTLTPDNNQIVINDNHGKKVLYFSLDGKLLSTTPAKFWFTGMEYAAPGDIVGVTYGMGAEDPGLQGYRNYKDLVFFMNEKLKIEGSCLPLKRDRYAIQVTPAIRKYGEGVYIHPVYSDTIYLARGNSLLPKYHIDMKAIGGEANFADKVTRAERDDLVKRAATFDGFFTDSDDHLVLSIGTPPDRIIDYYLYSKRSGKVYHYNMKTAQLENLINLYFNNVKTSYSDKLVAVVDSYILTGAVEKFPEAIPELVGIKDEDNPVVVFYTLKEDL